MKHKLNLDTWERKEHFKFFKQFEEPYYVHHALINSIHVGQYLDLFQQLMNGE